MNTPSTAKIIDFIKKHHVLTLATCSDNKPWCCNCFYAFYETGNLLVFTSEENTRHVAEALTNHEVSGSIVLETRIVGRIQGLQLTGHMFRPEGELLEKVRKRYLKRFPYARFMLAELWCIELKYLKYTDNTLGFGKKLIWDTSSGRNDL